MNPASSRLRSPALDALSWAVAALVASTAAAAPYKLQMFHAKDGTAIEYAVVLPEGAMTGQSMPAILAFPAGEQEEYEALQGLQQYWGKSAADKGWLSVTMLAPAGMKLHQDGAAYVPELLDEVEASHSIEGGKWHAVGYSDGGLGAFRAVIENPARFHSFVGFPGGPSRPEEIAALGRIVGIPVRFFSGSNDAVMVEVCRKTAERIQKAGGDATVTVFDGEDHVPKSFTADRLMDELARLREISVAASTAVSTPQSLLDEFHSAGLAADARRFFDCFAPDAEVLWMDFPARMNLKGLRKIVEPHLTAGEPLVLTALDSNVDLLNDGRAWFDQALITPKGDACRATGVATLGGSGWKISRLSVSCRAIGSARRPAPDAPAATEPPAAEASPARSRKPPR